MKRFIAILVLMPFIIGAFTGVTYGASGVTYITTKTGKDILEPYSARCQVYAEEYIIGRI